MKSRFWKFPSASSLLLGSCSLFALSLTIGCSSEEEPRGSDESRWAGGPYPGACVEERYSGSGDMLDLTITTTYDEAGEWLQVEEVKATDGTREVFVYENTYDDEGFLVAISIDKDSEGALGIVIENDADGNAVAEEGRSLSDGSFVYQFSASYDQAGNQLSTMMAIGDEATTQTKTAMVFTYDTQNRKLTKEVDIGADGEIDERTIYSYSSDKVSLREERDTNLDGTMDSYVEVTLDARGNQLVREEHDSGAEELSGRIVFSYDCWL